MKQHQSVSQCLISTKCSFSNDLKRQRLKYFDIFYWVSASVSANSPTPISVPSAVCLSCLCGNHMLWLLRPCHWFRCHICHTHVCWLLPLLGPAGLQEKASSAEYVTGWLFCLSGHRDPWPHYHLLALVLPPYVTLDCCWFWFSAPLLTGLHLCMITTTLATVGHS